MNVYGKRAIGGGVPDPLEVDEVVAKKLCVGDSAQELKYCLPEQAPVSAGQTIVSQLGGSTQWGVLPGVTNVLQRVIILEDEFLLGPGWISPQDDHLGIGFSLLNNHWTSVVLSPPTARQLARFKLCGDSPDPLAPLTVRTLKFYIEPAQGVQPPEYPFGLSAWAAGQRRTWEWTLWNWIVHEQDTLYDRLELSFWVSNDNNDNLYWNVYLADDSHPDPVWDNTYSAIAPGTQIATNVNRNLGDGSMRKITLDVDPQLLCDAPRHRLVFEAVLVDGNEGSNRWRSASRGSNAFAIRNVQWSGIRTGSGTTVGIPEDQIDHTVIQNIGVNSHAQLDAHKATMEGWVDQDVRVSGTPTFEMVTVDTSGTEDAIPAELNLRSLDGNGEISFMDDTTSKWRIRSVVASNDIFEVKGDGNFIAPFAAEGGPTGGFHARNEGAWLVGEGQGVTAEFSDSTGIRFFEPVKFGVGTSTPYQMPTSAGGEGQVLQMGAGNVVEWVNPSEVHSYGAQLSIPQASQITEIFTVNFWEYPNTGLNAINAVLSNEVGFIAEPLNAGVGKRFLIYTAPQTSRFLVIATAAFQLAGPSVPDVFELGIFRASNAEAVTQITVDDSGNSHPLSATVSAVVELFELQELSLKVRNTTSTNNVWVTSTSLTVTRF